MRKSRDSLARSFGGGEEKEQINRCHFSHNTTMEGGVMWLSFDLLEFPTTTPKVVFNNH